MSEIFGMILTLLAFIFILIFIKIMELHKEKKQYKKINQKWRT